MNAGNDGRPVPDLAARLAALSPEKRALLERQLGALTPVAVARRAESAADVRCLRLSTAQKRIWFLEQLESGHGLYNLPIIRYFSEPVDLQNVEQAINEIIRRHDCLRTTFRLAEDGPVQEIRPDLTVSVELTDLEFVSINMREAEAERLALVAVRRPFDLQRGPLLGGRLMRLSDDHHALIITIHQIVADKWSLGVFAREFDSIYAALCRESAWSLPPLEMSYDDALLQQREQLQGESLQRLSAYWVKTLDGVAPLLDLPTDYARPRSQQFRSSSLTHRYPRVAVDALYRLADQHGASPFTALLALFAVLLHRFSGISDIVVGCPVKNRVGPDQDRIIGLFADALVLRLDLSENPSFHEILERAQRVTNEAYKHQEMPLQVLLEEMEISRDLSCNPLFQVFFSMEKASNLPLSKSSFLTFDRQSSELDLSLSLIDEPDHLIANLEFNSVLFAEGTAESLAEAFGVLIESAVSFPDRPIAELPLLSATSRKQLISVSSTPGCMPDASTFHGIFELQARATPAAPALEFGDEIYSYGRIDSQASKLANALLAFGVGPEVVVGLCMDKSPDWVIALLAVMKAGATFLPLDPAYPAARIAFMLDDADVAIVLTHDSLRDRLPPFAGTIWNLEREWSRIEEFPARPQLSTVSPDSLAYVIYTSGSTGWPKGVMVPHRCVCNTMQTIRDALQLPAGTRVLQFGSLSFDISIYDLLMAFGCGGTLCIAPIDALVPGQPLADTLRDLRINAVALPPSALNAIPTTDLPDLRTIMSGGEALSAELAQRWSDPACRLINGYGPTEATIWATCYQCPGDNTVPLIGRAVPHTQAYVLDQSGEPRPYGFPGELCLGGAGVTRGYMRRADLTAECFVPDPYSDKPGSRLYRTGDRASLQSDGNIRFLGRLDNQIKLNGYRIELQEIEAVLARHPCVTEAAVVFQRSPGGETQLAAFCTTGEDAVEIRQELLLHLRRHLPKYAVPAVLTILDRLPVNTSGKLDRQKLSEWAEPAADGPREFATANRPEDMVAQIFAEILNLDRVGPRDSFFELGGHSLLAIRVIDRLNAAFQVSLTIRDLFENPVVADMVGALALAPPADADQAPIPLIAKGTATTPEARDSG